MHPWVNIIRPSHWLIDLPVLLAAASLITNGDIWSIAILFAILLSPLTHSTAILWNDTADLEGDRISRSNRPLVTGKLKPLTVWCIGAIMYIALAAIMFLMPSLAIIVFATILIMSILYNVGPAFKNRYIINALWLETNIVLGVPFISAYLYNKITTPAILFALAIFPIMLAAAFAKDFLDYEGDLKVGRKNILTKYGFKRGSIIVFVLTVTLAFISAILCVPIIGLWTLLLIPLFAWILRNGLFTVLNQDKILGHKFYKAIWRYRIAICAIIFITSILNI